MTINEGDGVAVTEPWRNYDGSWLLPGDKVWAVTVLPETAMAGRDRIRVRCPDSRFDGWVPLSLLTPQPDMHTVVGELFRLIAELRNDITEIRASADALS